MHDIIGTSFQVKNFKFIDTDPIGFDNIQPINIIVGKNNTGKTSLLEALGLITDITKQVEKHKTRGTINPTIIYTKTLEEEELRSTFSESVTDGELRGYGNHWQYGKHYIGNEISIELECTTGERKLLHVQDNNLTQPSISTLSNNTKNKLLRSIINKYSSKVIVKIDAERDVTPEINSLPPHITGSGSGVTNSIQNFLNNSDLDNRIIHENILNHINLICNPEIYFTKIECKRHKDDTWEIFLNEKDKGPIRLSNMGSGIKTIVHTLAATTLSSLIHGRSHGDIIYCIEEPENNLHPSILRRLLDYIKQHTESFNSCFFITTHSATAIDYFSKTPKSSIYHINTENEKTVIKKSITYDCHKKILDDLEIRASDLLQSNGIIWVEGPSDRTYLNKWISIFSNGSIQEGIHYQIVFYGGRLLSHLKSDNNPDSLINILNVNRNNAILIDSDKTTEHARLNSTKTRICKEIKRCGGMYWITHGKEIENYIPPRIVSILLGYNGKARGVGRYENFFQYVDEIKPHVGSRFKETKQQLSELASVLFTSDDILNSFDLHNKLGSLCGLIKSWNNIKT